MLFCNILLHYLSLQITNVMVSCCLLVFIWSELSIASLYFPLAKYWHWLSPGFCLNSCILTAEVYWQFEKSWCTDSSSFLHNEYPFITIHHFVMILSTWVFYFESSANQKQVQLLVTLISIYTMWMLFSMCGVVSIDL